MGLLHVYGKEGWVTFGVRLREWRRRRLLSQQELAKLLGMRYQTVQRWEAGTALPQPASRRKLCEVLKISSDELLGALEKSEGKAAA